MDWKSVSGWKGTNEWKSISGWKGTYELERQKWMDQVSKFLYWASYQVVIDLKRVTTNQTSKPKLVLVSSGLKVFKKKIVRKFGEENG